MTVEATTANENETPRRRGRPPRDPADARAREQLLRTGLAHLTERGYSAVSVDEILREAGVPKGSFYHYFGTKAAFGEALVDAYQTYFAGRLDEALLDQRLPPLARVRAFIAGAERGMARHDFRRGCLIGNLGQEMSALPETFRARLIAVFEDWQARLATCLRAAMAAGEIAPHHDPQELARFFWIGWEGAVLRARLEQGPEPLHLFAEIFFRHIEKGSESHG